VEDRLPRYTVRARIDPASHQLHAEVRIANPPSRRFYLHQGLSIRAVSTGRDRLHFREDPAAPGLPYSPAARAIVTGAPAGRTLQIVYDGAIEGWVSGVNGINAELIELALYSAWYPLFEGVHRFNFALEIELPEAFTLIANGRPDRSLKLRDGRLRHRWTSRRPGFDIAVVASPLLACHGEVKRGVTVCAHKFPPADITARRSALQEALEGLSRRFGAPRTEPGVRVVYSPRGGWGYARAPLIVLSEQRALAMLSSKPGSETEFHDLVHELAHFFWSIADPATPQDWINEALAEYSAYCVSSTQFGPDFAGRRLANYREQASRNRTSQSIAETPGDSPDREINRYNKAPLMLLEAERRFGRAALDRLLRDLHLRFAGTRRATTAVFLNLAAKHMGAHAAEFFSDELYRRPEPPDSAAGVAPAAEPVHGASHIASPQVLVEEIDGALPGQLGRRFVVARRRVVVKSVVRPLVEVRGVWDLGRL